jgi:hypothetical protein
MAISLDRETLTRVFSDAHVIDIDFSEWEEQLSLVVLADHYENWSDRKPCVIVTFHDVRNFEYTMSHSPGIHDIGDGHPHWYIDDLHIEAESSLMRLRLHGSGASPTLAILCKNVNVRSLDSASLDSIRPGWNRPGAGFARVSIENMAKK